MLGGGGLQPLENAATQRLIPMVWSVDPVW